MTPSVLLISNEKEQIFEELSLGFERVGWQAPYLKLLEGATVDKIQQTIEAYKPSFVLTREVKILTSLGAEEQAFYDVLKKYNLRLFVMAWESLFYHGTMFDVMRFMRGDFRERCSFLTADRGQVELYKSLKCDVNYFPIYAETYDPQNLAAASQRLDYDVAYWGTYNPGNNPNFTYDFKDLSPETLWDFSRAMGLDDSLFLANVAYSYSNYGFKNYRADILRARLTALLDVLYQEKNYNFKEYQDRKSKQTMGLLKDLTGDETLLFIYLSTRADWYYSQAITLQMLYELKRFFKVRVFGGPLWQRLLGLDYSTKYLPLSEIGHLIRSSSVSFCLTKFQFKDFFHCRPLGVLGQGGLALTDYRADADRLFKPGEIMTYQGLDDLLSKTSHFVNHRNLRDEAVEKGRARVMSEHTAERRVEQLINLLKEKYNISMGDA